MAQHDALLPKRRDERVIIHFDYDCFYAAVFEREDPKLRLLPFAVQQKQIIVTCNYEARRRGLHKLQLVKDARKKCPEVIIALGEDLTRFRNASKDNYQFLGSHAWSNKVERLGFDEVFMDVTDMVNYNIDVLNRNNLHSSFFHLDRNDPTAGFSFNASCISGHVFPAPQEQRVSPSVPSTTLRTADDELVLRLLLGSHLAQHLRHQLEEHKSYTSTVGISTNKLLSKLVGNLNKPKGQTTLLPPYCRNGDTFDSNVTRFLDTHDIGKVPGIGFKTAQKIRQYVLKRPAVFHDGLVYGPTKEQVSVGDVRLCPGMNAEVLERLLAGPGTPKDLGSKIWGLINGVDESEVAKARDVPQQISIEDSYIKLDTIAEVKRELMMLTCSLIKRMRLDLTATAEEDTPVNDVLEEDEPSRQTSERPRRWLAHPRTLRLTTRPRPPRNPDGSRPRLFNRISKSCPMPSFVFSINHSIDVIATKMVDGTLLPLFRQQHPEESGWDLSLVNLCATSIALTGADSKNGAGRDIGRMFRRQDDVLKDWKVEDVDVAPVYSPKHGTDNVSNAEKQHQNKTDACRHGSEDMGNSTQESEAVADIWDNEAAGMDYGEACAACGAKMPSFAMAAHRRFHSLADWIDT